MKEGMGRRGVTRSEWEEKREMRKGKVKKGVKEGEMKEGVNERRGGERESEGGRE